MVPFFAYVGLFLLLPTAFVLVGAFQSADGSPSLENLTTVLSGDRFVQAFGRSIQLSLVYALVLSFSAVYLPEGTTEYAIVLTFALLALVLAFRPQGLFGRAG